MTKEFITGLEAVAKLKNGFKVKKIYNNWKDSYLMRGKDDDIVGEGIAQEIPPTILLSLLIKSIFSDDKDWEVVDD